MLSYELAKKLKDAGFPQENRKFYYEFCPDEDNELVISDNAWHDTWTQEWGDLHFLKETKECACPTLSELIEVCGKKFSCLEKRTREDIWEAEYVGMVRGYGDTPEEAVTNLWLELNKK